MAAGGRTSWLPRDAAHHDRELVVELGEEFGPAGPYIDAVLRDLAQQQRNDGHVLTGFRSLARKTFTDPELVRRVVEHGASSGLFDGFRVLEDGRRFELWCSGWSADAKRGIAAVRKADQRSNKETEESCPSEKGHVPHVSPCVPLTIPNQTPTETPKPNVEFDESTAVRDLFEHWQTVCGHPRSKLTADRRRKIRARLREGYTVEQIRQAIDGAANRAFVNADGLKFDDIELICRNGAKVELFIARAAAKPPPADGGYLDELRQMHASATAAERQELAS